MTEPILSNPSCLADRMIYDHTSNAHLPPSQTIKKNIQLTFHIITQVNPAMSPSVICCGLSCVDMQLHACNVPQTLETITTFSNVTFTAGGCAPQTARALTALSVPTSVLSVIGDDPHGATLRELLTEADVDPSSLVIDSSQCTALAVLPLFTDSTRGCFITLGANMTADVEKLLPRRVIESSFTISLRVFHFGYPHLMPQLQGNNLYILFEKVREAAPRVILTMDVNGANIEESEEHPVLHPALSITAAIHANLEEACVITGLAKATESSRLSAGEIKPVVEWFTKRGAGIACITCGKDGVFVATGGEGEGDEWAHRLRISSNLRRGAFVYRRAMKVKEGVEINASGAGDAFTAGVIAELVLNGGEHGIIQVADAGIMSALHRLDSSFTYQSGAADIRALTELGRGRERLAPRTTLQQEQYEGDP